MRSKVMRACFMASLMTPSPGASRMMSAAARAASVAPATAMPQSALRSAGASLTPSPVMPTMCPPFCSASTMRYLSSGTTSAKMSTSSIISMIADSWVWMNSRSRTEVS